jgi:hypothetical protein
MRHAAKHAVDHRLLVVRRALLLEADLSISIRWWHCE